MLKRTGIPVVRHHTTKKATESCATTSEPGAMKYVQRREKHSIQQTTPQMENPTHLEQHDLTAPEHRPLHRRLGSIRRRRPLHLHQMRRCRPPSTDCLWQNHPVPILAIPHRSRHQASGLGRVPRLHPLGRTNPRRSHRLNLHWTRGWRTTSAEIRVPRAGGEDLS